MSMVGTFDGFTSARLGIYAAQHGLRVTGNNISNISTPGYTRQRVDQYSFKAGANDLYRSFYDNHIGAGALVKGISQVRDPYLDIRYRNLSTETYHNDTWLAGLQNIASILDEVGKGDNRGDGLLYAQLQDLAKKLRAYSANPTDLNDRLVRNSATSLTALFHNSADRLEKLYNETKKEFTEDISAVNEILINIRDLNQSIREAEIHGDTALEMRDERNRQIDALSQYMDIKVEYSYEHVGAGKQVEKLTISLNNANPDNRVHTDEAVLVDGVYATQLSVPEEKPVLNTYDTTGAYWYLKNYTYLRAIPDGEDLDRFLADNDLIFDDLVTAGVDKSGNTLYLIGTNDPDLPGVITEKNDNFTIQLSPLMNIKNELWKSSTTRWEEVAGTPVPYNKWGFSVSSDLKGGQTFTIGTQEYFVVDENNPLPDGSTAIAVNLSDIEGDKFAGYIAKQLKALDQYKDYEITAKNGQIIFTATDSDDKTGPSLSVKPEGAGITVGARQDLDPSIKYEAPADMDQYPQYKYDEHGNVIQTINYAQADDGKWYRLQIDTEYTHEITLDDNDLRGILQAEREMLTEEGEFASEKDLAIDENALIKRGIPYYIKSLDLLAQKFAEAYNKLNSGYAYNQDGYYINKDGEQLVLPGADGNDYYISTDGLNDSQKQNLVNNGYFLKNKNGEAIDADGKVLLGKDGNPIKGKSDIFADDGTLLIDEETYGKLEADLDSWLANEENGAYFMGGVLFSNRGDGNDTTRITAANISIAADWSNGVYGLIPTFKMLFADDGSGGLTHSTQNDNADHMVAIIENPLTYDPRDLFGSDAIGPVLFEGCFNDMLSNMMAVQGEDSDITTVRLVNATTSLNELDFSREGVSGVDLNDEAMNMVSYQKAMSAAMRLMTAIDEMLDRLINNTGIAGR